MELSFVIPAYNEEKNIVDCIKSIKETMEGRQEQYEIIVVDNNCTDKTKELAESVNARVVQEPRKGIVWARSAGLASSTGVLIANIDADNRLPKDWANKVFKYFNKYPELLALSGPLVYYDTTLYVRFWTRLFYILGFISSRISSIFVKNSMLQGGNYVVKRIAMEKIGGYDTSIEFYGEDIDIGSRVSKVGKVIWTFKLPTNSSGRRINGEGLFVMGVKYGLNYLWIIFFKKPFTYKYKDFRN